MRKFVDLFWGTPDDPLLGVQKLHKHMEQCIAQSEELAYHIKSRYYLDENYGRKLTELSEYSRDFGKEMSTLGVELKVLGQTHLKMAQSNLEIVQPLVKFAETCKRQMVPKMEQMEQLVKQYLKLKQETLKVEQLYISKTEKAQSEQREHKNSPLGQIPIMDVMAQIGPKTMTIQELNQLLKSMQQNNVSTLLGVWKDCQKGCDLMSELEKHNYTQQESESMLSDLVRHQFLKPVSGRVGSYTLSNQSYQWVKYALESSDEPAHVRTWREVDRHEFDLRRSMIACESVRLKLEMSMTEYMQLSQSLLKEHVSLVKDSIAKAVKNEALPALVAKEIEKQMTPFLEALNPTRELQGVLERDKTGLKHIPTMACRTGQGYLDTFGAPLDDIPKDKHHIPPFVRKIEPSGHIQAVHSLRKLLNNGKASRKALRKYPPETLVAVLKLYLLELPISVDEVYEPLKLLYLSKTEDLPQMRLSSLRSLLATLSTCHFATLYFFVQYWSTLTSGLPEQDPRIGELASVLGTLVLRPRHESHLTDLLLHTNDILSPSSMTPSTSQEFVSEDSDSLDDEEASTRAIFPQRRLSNSSMSIASGITKKTATSFNVPESEASHESDTEVQSQHNTWIEDRYTSTSFRSVMSRTSERHSNTEPRERKEVIFLIDE
ncbi:hypothetical protein EDD86DRAFT_248040 [Gorgonomyces haynaldii]|nr:hypothetical protein EDD86DRAFT_248040 [Gorgonomyces haynaldii]